jgi:hypothetical protein
VKHLLTRLLLAALPLLLGTHLSASCLASPFSSSSSAFQDARFTAPESPEQTASVSLALAPLPSSQTPSPSLHLQSPSSTLAVSLACLTHWPAYALAPTPTLLHRQISLATTSLAPAPLKIQPKPTVLLYFAKPPGGKALRGKNTRYAYNFSHLASATPQVSCVGKWKYSPAVSYGSDYCLSPSLSSSLLPSYPVHRRSRALFRGSNSGYRC